MTRRTVLAALLIVAALASGAAAQEVRLLNGFNSADEMNRFGWSSSVKAELTVEHKTEGTHAVQVTFPGELVKYGGFGIKAPAMMIDWDRWDLLTFDVFNPTKDLHTVV
ncbi:MAG TPA: hypothetical protein VMX57_05110, partial [Planctomycetota bacterium]|nr:hypothetical protein [Planctomycetota bacterium]